MTPSSKCIGLVKSFENCRLEAYRDIKGILTIAYGHTANVKEGDACTQEQADQWLSEDLQKACDCVLNGLDCALTQNEADALFSLTYNIGCGNFHHSILRLCLSRGQYNKAADQFLVWCHATMPDGSKPVVQGLLARRQTERALFLGNSQAVS